MFISMSPEAVMTFMSPVVPQIYIKTACWVEINILSKRFYTAKEHLQTTL